MNFRGCLLAFALILFLFVSGSSAQIFEIAGSAHRTEVNNVEVAAYGHELIQATGRNISSNSWLIPKLSDQDVILAISSIEWGNPDRWSFTSRYIHMFEKNRDNKTWLNNLSLAVSPGTAGGRLAFGYQGVYTPRSMPDFAIFSETRIVLLRTWGNPLSTYSNRTFIGAEIRGGLSFLFNVGIGYYSQISNSNGPKEKFYGLHIGIGI